MNKQKLAEALLNKYVLGVGAGAAGLGAGAALGSVAFENHQNSLPHYQQRLTLPERATRDSQGDWGQYTTPEEYMMIQGISQGLIGGSITGDDLNEMIMSGSLPPVVQFLTNDIHDMGHYLATNPNDPRYDQFIAREKAGEDEWFKRTGYSRG